MMHFHGKLLLFKYKRGITSQFQRVVVYANMKDELPEVLLNYLFTSSRSLILLIHGSPSQSSIPLNTIHPSDV